MDDHQEDASIRRTEKAAAIFRDIASRKVERPTAPRFYGHKAALVLGALLGLAYGLAAQFCNSLVSPSIPYTHYPFGTVGNIAASVIGFTLISWIVSLPRDFARGALAGAAAAVCILLLHGALTGGSPLAALALPYAFFTVLGLFIELMMALVVMVIYRWTIELQTDHFDKPVWSWPRGALPLLFLVGAVGLGFFSLYPEDVRAAMSDTNDLIRRGLAASTQAELPPALQNENQVQDFLYHADPSYTLELGSYVTIIENPLTEPPGYAITIVARFKNGWAISCLYRNGLQDPTCRSYDPAHTPPMMDFRAAIRPPLL